MKVDKLNRLLEETLSPAEIERLFFRAKRGDTSLLQRDDVATLQKPNGDWSLLHTLAYRGVKEVLNHPEVSTAKHGDEEWTPLHAMASNGYLEVLQHPDVDKVKTLRGETPADLLSLQLAIPKEKLLAEYQLEKTKFKPLNKRIDLD